MGGGERFYIISYIQKGLIEMNFVIDEKGSGRYIFKIVKFNTHKREKGIHQAE